MRAAWLSFVGLFLAVVVEATERPALPHAADHGIFDSRRAVSDPDVMRVFAGFFRTYHLTLERRELAAFLMRSPEGHVSCLEWPTSFEAAQQTFHGALPTDTVAILHTHPPGYEIEPSASDVALSLRSGLPVYVLTPRHIYVVDARTGESAHLVHDKNWAARVPKSVRVACAQ